MSTTSRLFSLKDIIGNRRENIAAILPISRSNWYAGVASGRFPQPVRIGRRTMWRSSDIEALIAGLE
ncbi:MAG: AlpA family phage regulatory protein [Caulobacteraceae bacterium]|nr:AlpA family phage regulatory protein [Caulobacteraceae bacterium]